MLSTTDDLHIRNIERLHPPDVMGARNPIGAPQDHEGSPGPSASVKPAANVYPFVKAAHHDGGAHRGPVWTIRVWWERWLERRWFARVLPLLADEVLEDYGLTREEARRLCRRPFWLA